MSIVTQTFIYKGTELYHSYNLQLLIGRGTSHLDQFRHSNNPVYKKIWRDKVEPFIHELPLVRNT